jgi:hypothetical protein
MSEPRSRRSATTRLLGLALLVMLTAACGRSPRVGTGTVAQAKTRVIALVNATGAAVRSRVTFEPVRSADELPCKKTLFGYSVGSTHTRRAEVPTEVAVKPRRNGPGDGASLLPTIEQYWRNQGYAIDRSGMSDRRFPKLRARVGTDELLVATGYVGLPQLNLYAVSACVRS